jgi:hypothetical protein
LDAGQAGLDLLELFGIPARLIQQVVASHIRGCLIARILVAELLQIPDLRFGAHSRRRKLITARSENPPKVINLTGRECHERLSKLRV